MLGLVHFGLGCSPEVVRMDLGYPHQFWSLVCTLRRWSRGIAEKRDNLLPCRCRWCIHRRLVGGYLDPSP